jgi:hypothetical protein
MPEKYKAQRPPLFIEEKKTRTTAFCLSPRRASRRLFPPSETGNLKKRQQAIKATNAAGLGKSKGRGHPRSTPTTQHSQQAAESAHPQAGSDRTPPHLRGGSN